NTLLGKSGTPWPADNILPARPTASPPAERIAAKPALPIDDPLPRTPLPSQEGAIEPPVRERVVAQPSSTGSRSATIWPQDAPRDPPTLPSTGPAVNELPVEPSSPLRDHPSPSGRSEEKPQLTSSKSFALEYDLDSVGPAGTKAVELWVTT